MTAISLSTLGYESRLDREALRKRWLGLTSLGCWGLALLFAVVCLVGATRASGWDGLSWIVAAFLGSWIGCGIGAFFATFGLFPRHRRHRFALTGLILNLLTGLGPITLIWLGAVL